LKAGKICPKIRKKPENVGFLSLLIKFESQYSFKNSFFAALRSQFGLKLKIEARKLGLKRGNLEI